MARLTESATSYLYSSRRAARSDGEGGGRAPDSSPGRRSLGGLSLSVLGSSLGARPCFAFQAGKSAARHGLEMGLDLNVLTPRSEEVPWLPGMSEQTSFEVAAATAAEMAEAGGPLFGKKH